MGGRGEGAGQGWGEGPCAGAAPPLRAAHSPPPSPPGAAASTSTLPPPRRSLARRRWTWPTCILLARLSRARRSSRSWRKPPPRWLRTGKVPRLSVVCVYSFARGTSLSAHYICLVHRRGVEFSPRFSHCTRRHISSAYTVSYLILYRFLALPSRVENMLAYPVPHGLPPLTP